MALDINIQNILNTLSYQFNSLLRNNDYGIDNIVVGNERYFVENPLENRQLGIVFSLGSGLVDFNEAVLPFDLVVLGQNDQMEITQKLLYDFVLAYTNTLNNGYYQRYSTPTIDDEFVEYAEDIRTLWGISGTIRFASSESANVSVQWLNGSEDFETIETLDLQFTLSNEPSPQPMSDSYGENITINRINTFTINFTTYANKGDFYTQILADQVSLDRKNTRYDMRIDFGNGIIYNLGMVVVNITGKQELGQNALVSITMAR